MSVNKNIWETDKTLTLNGASFEYSKTIGQLFTDGKLILNSDFDKSIYMWDREPVTYNFYRLNVSRDPEICAYNADKTTAISLGYSDFESGYFPVGFPSSSVGTDPLTYAMRPDQKENTRPRYGNVITNFDYKTIVFCIYVKATSDNAPYNIRTFPLKNYFESQYNQYPNICAVTAKAFCGTNKNRIANTHLFASMFTNITYNSSNTSKTYLSPPLAWASILETSSAIPIFGGCDNTPGNEFNTRIQVVYDPNNISSHRRYVLGNQSQYELIYDSNGSSTNYKYYFIRYHLSYNDIIKESLKWGFIITDNENSAKNGDILSDDNIFIPTISPSGNVTDDYTHGNDNQNQSQITWKNPWDDSGYDPNDPNRYTDKIALTKPGLTTTGIFNRTFALTASNVNDLSNYLWNADETIFTEIVKGLALMGGNPIDGLIDLRLYPFDCASKGGGGHSESIVVGRTDTNVSALKINTYNAILELGSCTFYNKFGNFLDYEPYTTASLYIPYVGIVPISTAVFAGQIISCKMVVDITTGSCTAIVFCNNIPMIYKNGTIGVEIPMTATNSGQYASRIVGGLTSAATDLTLGAATGNVGQMISGAGSLAEAALNTGSTIYNTAGTSSPSCSLWQPQNCYFIIQRPVPIVPENYGHNVGYACNYQAKISDCSGYTQTYNVDVSTINAPENEKSMIANILNTGFYA